MKVTTVLLCLILLFQSIFSQEFKKITEKKENSLCTEEYYVLKTDKSVKHGRYVKYIERLAIEKYILEFGSYEQNNKTGVWFTFNITHPLNPIKSVGEYSNGMKNGQWFYFHTPDLKDTSVLSLLGFKKLTQLIPPKRKDQEFQISIDTTGITLAAAGSFENNKKTGKWRYYTTDGRLVKEYDFTEKKFTYNIQDDSPGTERPDMYKYFQEQLTQILIESLQYFNSFQSSKVKFEIITIDGNFYVNNLTTPIFDPFSVFLEYQLRNMPTDWIDYDPSFEKFSFTFELDLKINNNIPSFNFGTFTTIF